MTDAYEKYWADDANWHMGIYSCADDPRVIVPKKPKWTGKTLNFAHRKAAWAVFAATLSIALLPTIITFGLYGVNAPLRIEFWAGQAVCIAAIVVMYYVFEFKVGNEN